MPFVIGASVGGGLRACSALAGLPVPAEAVAELASMVRAEGADDLADRLDRALADGVRLLALTRSTSERSLLSALEDPPSGLAELRGVLANEDLVAPARGTWLYRLRASTRRRSFCQAYPYGLRRFGHRLDSDWRAD